MRAVDDEGKDDSGYVVGDPHLCMEWTFQLGRAASAEYGPGIVRTTDEGHR